MGFGISGDSISTAGVFDLNYSMKALQNAWSMVMPFMSTPKEFSPSSENAQLPNLLAGSFGDDWTKMFLPMFQGSASAMPYANFSMGMGGSNNMMNQMCTLFTSMFSTLAPKFDNKTGVKFKDISSSVKSDYRPNDTTYFNYDFKITDRLKKKGLSDAFYTRVTAVAKRIGCDPVDLLAVMQSESGIKPSEPNAAGSGAMGLIQFMPRTAKDLGTTVDELSKMSAEKQLDYVEKYYLIQKRNARIPKDQKVDGATLYALTYYPRNAANDVITTSANGAAYSQNNVFDINKDGKITKEELQDFVNKARNTIGFDSVAYS